MALLSHSFVCQFDLSQSGVDESACVHGLWTQCLQGLFWRWYPKAYKEMGKLVPFVEKL